MIAEEENYITVYINGEEKNKVLLEDAIKQKMTIRDIVMKEIRKSPAIQAVAEFFVKVNGKRVIPKDVKSMSIEEVKTIEISDSVPIAEKVSL